ncbi:hypothetical protein, partial [Tenacibaculum maritimum]
LTFKNIHKIPIFIDIQVMKLSTDLYLFINDGFWDADFIDENTLGRLGVESFKPDGLGPNLERFGGIPYRYLPQTISYKAKNPGYLN